MSTFVSKWKVIHQCMNEEDEKEKILLTSSSSYFRRCCWKWKTFQIRTQIIMQIFILSNILRLLLLLLLLLYIFARMLTLQFHCVVSKQANNQARRQRKSFHLKSHSLLIITLRGAFYVCLLRKFSCLLSLLSSKLKTYRLLSLSSHDILYKMFLFQFRGG
jgi:hypothetical protein